MKYFILMMFVVLSGCGGGDEEQSQPLEKDNYVRPTNGTT